MKSTRLMAGLLACAFVFLGVTESEEEKKKEEEPQKSGLVQEVVVTASRAGEDSPATFTNLSQEKIEDEYDVQDIPALLRATPSVYSYSDGGNDVGYSYMSIRGFDQRRTAVTINGVPLNDAESHQVYWIDLPNFPDSLEDVQVQRGAGTSVYGGNAIGGTVNLETAHLDPGQRFSYDAGYGSYGTFKVAASWVSDLVADRWVFGAQLSRIETDGYRDQSWAKLTSGFFTAQRLGEQTKLRINLYAGREETHLAYEGLTREQLQQDRRQNPLDWAGEIDHFTQPHFEVIHQWHPTEKFEFANTVYAFYGDGYFNQFRERKTFAEVRLDDWDVDGDGTVDRKGPIFRRRQVKEWDLGWTPRIRYDHTDGVFTAGVMIRKHRGEHYGRVTGALPPGTSEPFDYYNYEVPKTTRVLYVQEEWKATSAVTVVAGLQHVSNSWKLEKDLVTGLNYDVDYSWFAPRLALNWRFSHRLRGFVSVAHSRREPGVKDLYDPSDIYKPAAFETTLPDGTLRGPLVEEEKLNDYELGLSYVTRDLVLKATIYDMEFKDELVYLGQRNDLGEGVTGNAERSVHRGLELEWAARLAPRLELTGHAMLAGDELTDFVLPVLDWETNEWTEVDYSGNRVPLFPDLLGRVALAYKPDWGRVELGASHTGRVYIDPSETREMSVDPFTVFHLDGRYDLPRTDNRYALHLRVNNLLDHEYEGFGYSDFGTPVFLPAAERHLFLMLSYKQAP